MKTLFQLAKQALVGLSNAVLNFLIFLLLVKILKIYYILGNITAGIFSFFYVFWGQKKFTFQNQSQNHSRQYFRFLFFSLSYLTLETLLLRFLKMVTGLDVVWLKLATLGILFFYSFFFQKYIVFRETAEN